MALPYAFNSKFGNPVPLPIICLITHTIYTVGLCFSTLTSRTDLYYILRYYCTLCVRKVITFCVEKLLHFAWNTLLHFASMLLHFAAIVITFCVSITFWGDYYILRRNSDNQPVCHIIAYLEKFLVSGDGGRGLLNRLPSDYQLVILKNQTSFMEPNKKAIKGLLSSSFFASLYASQIVQPFPQTD